MAHHTSTLFWKPTAVGKWSGRSDQRLQPGHPRVRGVLCIAGNRLGRPLPHRPAHLAAHVSGDKYRSSLTQFHHCHRSCPALRPRSQAPNSLGSLRCRNPHSQTSAPCKNLGVQSSRTHAACLKHQSIACIPAMGPASLPLLPQGKPGPTCRPGDTPFLEGLPPALDLEPHPHAGASTC